MKTILEDTEEEQPEHELQQQHEEEQQPPENQLQQKQTEEDESSRHARRRCLLTSIALAAVLTTGVVLLPILLSKRTNSTQSSESSSKSSHHNGPTFSPTITVFPTQHLSYLKRPSIVPTHPPSAPVSSSRPTSSIPRPSPVSSPTLSPSGNPSVVPTVSPSLMPTSLPSSSMPTSIPSGEPSSIPSGKPSPVTTSTPSQVPTPFVPTVAPSIAPSPGGLSPKQGQPTLTPTNTLSPSIIPRSVNETMYSHLMQLLTSNDVDQQALGQNSTREYQAFQFLIRTSQVLSDQILLTSDVWWLQRFALTSLYLSLNNSTSDSAFTKFHIPRVNEDHCNWRGITCRVNYNVTDIVWPRRNFTGTLPFLEWTLLSSSLTQIDLSGNGLFGTLPASLYALSSLEVVYLNSNNISGPLHNEAIVQDVTWPNLTRLYLNDNQLTGPLPDGLRSNQLQRPLRFVLLQNNRLTGTFPSNLNWQNLFYLDLGNNLLEGTLPSDSGSTFFALRNLYLDSNRFTGTMPQSWGSLGGGRLMTFVVNNNQFSGGVPTGWGQGNKLIELDVSYNNFTQPLDVSICKMSMLYQQNGVLVELDADCKICSCQYMCNSCTNYSR